MADSAGAVAPLHLVLGDEAFLVERATTQIISAVRASASSPEVPINRLRAGDSSDAELLELLSPSLFADERVVVLTDADEAGADAVKAVTAAVQDTLPEGIVLIVEHSGGGRAKALAETLRRAGAQVHLCPALKGSKVNEFIRDELRASGIRTSTEVVVAIAAGVGSDARQLASAISQLASDTGGKVDLAAVARYHHGRAEVTGFDIADAALVGDRAGAIEALRWSVVRGVPYVLVADALARGVQTIARVAPHGRADPFRLANQLKLSKFQVEKAQAQSRGWTPATIAAALQVVAKLNSDVKGQAVDPAYAAERAVTQLLELQNA